MIRNQFQQIYHDNFWPQSAINNHQHVFTIWTCESEMLNNRLDSELNLSCTCVRIPSGTVSHFHSWGFSSARCHNLCGVLHATSTSHKYSAWGRHTVPQLSGCLFFLAIFVSSASTHQSLAWEDDAFKIRIMCSLHGKWEEYVSSAGKD